MRRLVGISVFLAFLMPVASKALEPPYTFVGTNFPLVNLPTVAGQQVPLGAVRIPGGYLNRYKSFDIWAGLTWAGGFYNGGAVQPRLYLCDTSTCTGQLNVELGYVETASANPFPTGINVRGSYVITGAGANWTAVGTETVQFDMTETGTPHINSYSNQMSEPFNAAQAWYIVVMMYLDSAGAGEFGTPNAQMNVLRVNVLH